MALTDLPERLVRRFDDLQQDHRLLAQPVGVIRKYADDRGSAFAGLVTFQVFLGMLPLLVLVLSVLEWVSTASGGFRKAILDSTLAQLPLVGPRIRQDLGTLAPHAGWVAVSALGLLWTAAGIYHGMQLALNQVWNVQGVERQGFVSRHVRALVLFALVITAALGTAVIRDRAPRSWGPPLLVDVVSALGSVLLAALLLLAVFRLAVAPSVPLQRLVPAAVLAGLFWQLLQRVGTWVVMDRLRDAENLYGSIGFVVVTLFWINLLARSAVFANEWAVVSWRGLWPRRIAQPPLTKADKRVLEAIARNERRRPEEHVDIAWDDADDGDADSGPEADTDSGPEADADSGPEADAVTEADTGTGTDGTVRRR